MMKADKARELTMVVLEPLIIGAAEKGNSILNVSEYKIGSGMEHYLRGLGYDVYVSSVSDFKTISW